jgi:hypothetical protein
MDKPYFTNPRAIVIVCGTNDLNRNVNDGVQCISDLVLKAAQNFPDAVIIMSSILPREDMDVRKINLELRRQTIFFAECTFGETG